MLRDHINMNLKRGVKILTCDPANRLIEAETRNGEVIIVNAYHYTPTFRWPTPGEKWVVREENGSWYLDGIYEQQGIKEGEVQTIEPGDMVISTSSGRILVNIQGALYDLKIEDKDSGDLHYVFSQGVPSATWIIKHNLGKYPSVFIQDTAKDTIEGIIKYISINEVIVKFSSPISGEAYLN